MYTLHTVRAAATRALLAAAAGSAACACTSSDSAAPGDAGPRDATSAPLDATSMTSDAPASDRLDAPDVTPLDALAPDADPIPAAGTFCSLPGSVVETQSGPIVMPGADASVDAAAPPDLSWLTVPFGFCAHYFANVPHVRQLRFAPGGDLFAASPSEATAGSSADTPSVGTIMVLPDDDHDGVADSTPVFVSGVAEVQGMAFAAGNFYYQDGTTIRAVPFSPGDRAPPDAGAIQSFLVLGPSQVPQAADHWPKNVDVAPDGTFYVTNGGEQSDLCESTWPVRGSVFKAGASPGAAPILVAKGFRNPIALRCEARYDVCLAVELSLDGSNGQGGREKIVPVRQGDDWGFPCCATQYVPFTGTEFQDTAQLVTPADCADVPAENVSFLIGNTPFGIDYETGRWPAPWTDRAFVTLHGNVGTWTGARVVGLALDPESGLPLPASDLDGGSGGDNMLDFATGWDDGRLDHGRPAPIAFAPDGRMFVGNDYDGDVVWIAPIGLRP